MEHVTWKSPGPMCGLVGRTLHPNSCTSVSFWSKVPLLSIWSVAVPLSRLLLPCPSRWHGSLPWNGLWWLTCELHCSPLPWRLWSVYQLWKSPLLSCVPWLSDRTSCLFLQRMSWSSSCKGHDRSIRSSLSLTLSFGWTTKFRSVRWGRLAVTMPWDFRILAQSFHIWHDNHTFVIASCVFLLSLLRPSKNSPRCPVWPYRLSREGSHTYWAL